MKILRLDLRAFGPFTDVLLDLSGGNEGLHVIYGPNEAGKSSALRALEQMFFGIPAKSQDDFLHPYQHLRIGATLSRPGASPLTFLRRKGAKNTLLADDGATLLDEAALRPFLEGLDQNAFATRFGIGHAQLVKGGKEVVEGGGDVGQLLFAAGSGIAGLRSVRDRLEQEADDLFRPRGQTQRINQRLRDLKLARDKIGQCQLHGDDWAGARKALDEAVSRLGEVDQRLHRAQSERRRLERIRQALPLVCKRKDGQARLEALGKVVLLPAGFAERRREAMTALTLAQQAHATAKQELARLDEQLRALVIPEALLAESPRIERLPDLVGSHRKARRDLPALRARRDQLRDDAAEILRELRPDLTLDAPDQIRPTRTQQLQIQDLGRRDAALSNEIRRAEEEIEASRVALAQAQSDLDATEKPRDPAALKTALRRAQSQGNLQEQFDEAAAALAQAEQQAAVELARLPLWSGTLEQLERLCLPRPETVDRWENDLDRAAQQLQLFEERTAAADAERADLDRQIDQLRLEGDVPTEESLLAARRLRDAGWELVVAAWQGGGPDSQRLAEFLTHFPAQADLPAAYREAVAQADALADRLRREAHRVATRAGLQARRDAAARQVLALRPQADEARAQLRRLEQAWAECWRPAGIEPLSPREMRAWLVQQRSLAAQGQPLRAQRTSLRQLEQRIATTRDELQQGLSELGQHPAAKAETLSALMDRCAAAVEQLDEAAARRRQLEREVQQLQSRLAAAQSAADKARAERAQWRGQWSAAIEPLGLPPDTTPAVANEFVARIGDLFDRLKDARALEERIAGIDRDAQAFHEQVADLCRHVAPDLAALPAEQGAEELIARLHKAQQDCKNRNALQAEHDRHLAERDRAAQAIRQQTALLATMCREASCATPEALPRAEADSDKASRLLDAIASLDEQLLELSSGAGIEALLEEVAAVKPDDLDARLAQLDENIQQAETERQRLSETIGAARNRLASMDDSAVAADAAEEAQDLLARLEADVEHYVRLRFALAVLREGIERYRAKHQTHVLTRASELFQQLTLGSFEGLRADVEEQGKSVLVGVRPGGKQTVGLSGMSDGTGDQLYLALRLASLENHLASHEPVPFIVDDILISFDDARAMAALGLLAEFSRRVQILFFTHHQHLVELARSTLPEGVLFVHELRRNA